MGELSFVTSRWRSSILVCIAFVACAPSLSRVSLPTEEPEEEDRIAAGDVFEVRVYGEEHLSGKYQVGSGGTVDYPFLGSVKVEGEDANAVAQKIASGLRDGGFLVDPHVSIFVEVSTSRRVSVLGAVAKPGTLPLIAGMTVVQAVSQAGGFTPLASKDETVITRRVHGKLERYKMRVSEISTGNAADVNLKSGDIIFVPERVF